MISIVRLPQVALAALIEWLRHVPGAAALGRIVPWLAGLLVLSGAVALLIWMGQPSPERISLADLAGGKLPRLQSWIIVTGDIVDTGLTEPGTSIYRLTHPDAPNAYLLVHSQRPLEEGRITVSGRIEGGREPVPPGYAWSARLDADSSLATELPPPWAAALLAAAGILLLAARGSAYPVFTRESPGRTRLVRGSLRVGVIRESAPASEPAAPATLRVGLGGPAPVVLEAAGAAPMAVPVHSAYTSVEVGMLRRVRGASPALRVRVPAEDLTMTFSTREERDWVYEALTAEARARVPGSRR